MVRLPDGSIESSTEQTDQVNEAVLVPLMQRFSFLLRMNGSRVCSPVTLGNDFAGRPQSGGCNVAP
jgi:hypothetical protein